LGIKEKKIHTAATERYRLNTITSLETVDGRTISVHHGKATLLWEEYKDRLGCSTQIQMHFNLHELVHHHNLEQIEPPFTKEDIDNVIKKLSSDKAPGPNSFNGLFLKKTWHIIKEDIYELCFDFFSGRVDIQAINNSFITLVPKVNSPTGVNDFKPISLINCIVKIVREL
jgi:Holliday junction resolvase RusA-like endonuclease